MIPTQSEVIAVSQIIGGLVGLSCAVIAYIYIQSKSEGMQTFFDRASGELYVVYGLYTIVLKSTFVYGELFPGTLGSTVIFILTILNQSVMLLLGLHSISLTVIKYLSIYHETVLHVDENKVIERLRYCFWISSPILETIDMIWFTDSTMTMTSQTLNTGSFAGGIKMGIIIDTVLALHLLAYVGVHLRNEYTNCKRTDEQVEQNTFNLSASRMVMMFMFSGLAMIYFLPRYFDFDESTWVELISILLMTLTLDVLQPVVFLLHNKNVRTFTFHNLKRLLCFTDNIVHVME
jgi:hypothetical protein